MTETPFTVCIMASESARLEERLAALLDGADVAVPQVEVLESVDSTNRYLLESCESRGDARPHICLARSQTAGRGRRGRTWYSPAEACLSLSLAWPLTNGPVPPAYPVGVGLGVIRALEGLGFEGIRLKWPNDLMVGAAKLGGILVEQRPPSHGRPGWLVVGIGINREGADTLALKREVIDLAALGAAPDLLELASHVVAAQCRLHAALMQDGIASLAPELERADALRGQWVEVLDTRACGRVLGIDPASGCLLVDFEDGAPRALHSGEVSVRSCEYV